MMSRGAMPDHYKTIGVPRSATPDEIRAAVDRFNANACEPRSWGAAPPPSVRALSEAHYWLGDPARRQEYDRALAERESKQVEVNQRANEQKGSCDQAAMGWETETPAHGFHRGSKVRSLVCAFRAAGGGFRRGFKLPTPAAPPAYRSKVGTSAFKTSEKVDAILLQIGGIFLLAFGIWAAFAGYGWLNNLGWINHSENASVQIDGNWMMGEYRHCSLNPASADQGVQLLDCTQYSPGEPHILPVTFSGRIDRNEISGWKCQRQHGVLAATDSIVCRAVD